MHPLDGLSPELANGLVVGSVALALAVISLLGWSVRNLIGFTRVMATLNDSLDKSYEQREKLRAEAEQHRQLIETLEASLKKAEAKILALQQDKGALKDAIDELRGEAEQRDKMHAEVVEALTAQIGQLKQALKDEQAERQKTERELKRQIDELTKQNAALTAENQSLRADLAETRAALVETDRERNGLQEEVAALRAEVAAMRARTDDEDKPGEGQPLRENPAAAAELSQEKETSNNES